MYFQPEDIWKSGPTRTKTGPVRNSGPKSGQLYRTKSVRSGPKFAGPEFRTYYGPKDRTNQVISVRNSGPTRIDRIGKFCWSGSIRVGPELKLVSSGLPDQQSFPTWSGKVIRILVRISGPDQLLFGLVQISKNFFKLERKKYQKFIFKIII